MTFKILPILVAVITLALWPQGVILCAGEEGHVEVELEGAGCCPSETDEECVDCFDFGAPDQRSAPSTVVLAPPATSAESLRPDDLPSAEPSAHTTPLLPPRESVLEGVILIV
jgi:hypothetical protein